ncbi:MAG: radical SAM protein [Pseudomonadota bacterium]
MNPETAYSWEQVMSWDLEELLDKARKLSWSIHGRQIQFFIPGQMVYMGERGRYPAISITGTSCALNCDHCHRKILEGMVPATEPLALQEICKRLDQQGNLGVLLSGGSDRQGFLPWRRFLEPIQWIKKNTRLKISVHTGIVDLERAIVLRDSGIDELLVDVVGSEETMRDVYHLPDGLRAMESSLEALAAAGIPLIPHIVVGLHYGRINGEMHALEMVARYPVSTLVVVVLNPLKGTPMEGVQSPEPETVGRFVAAARLRIPQVPLALSCARPSGGHRVETDTLALAGGINRIAMPAEETLQKAKEIGLSIEFHKTCCSKSY